jgi:hypothetical protein
MQGPSRPHLESGGGVLLRTWANAKHILQGDHPVLPPENSATTPARSNTTRVCVYILGVSTIMAQSRSETGHDDTNTLTNARRES